MRIRKRFPLSSMAASQVSDPQLNNSTLVQQTSSSSELHPIQNMGMQPKPNTDSQPSDPPNHHLPSDQTPIIINKFQIKQKKEEEEEASREQEEEEEENGSNNNTRKEYNFLGVAPVGETRILPPLGSHQQVDRRWFDGDEKIPMKKRKGVEEKTGQETVLMLEEEEKKMKSKTNKKCTTSGMQQDHSDQDKAGNDDSSSTPNNNSAVKKMNKRGGVIMEGSRCSRVNGRGWRCCQQTLVGYSLCEHHLGKGRLRSISNVKGRTKVPAVVATTNIAPHQNDTIHVTATNDSTTQDNQSSSSKRVLVSSSVVQPVRDRKESVLLGGSCYDDDDEDEEEEDEDDDDYSEGETKKPVVVKKKRMKLGMVKARSLSSLLNQIN